MWFTKEHMKLMATLAPFPRTSSMAYRRHEQGNRARWQQAYCIHHPSLAGAKLSHRFHIAGERGCCQAINVLWADAEPLEFRVV